MDVADDYFTVVAKRLSAPASVCRDRAAKAPSQQLTTFDDFSALRSLREEEAQPDALATTHSVRYVLDSPALEVL